jgi:hypothetical protein
LAQPAPQLRRPVNTRSAAVQQPAQHGPRAPPFFLQPPTSSSPTSGRTRVAPKSDRSWHQVPASSRTPIPPWPPPPLSFFALIYEPCAARACNPSYQAIAVDLSLRRHPVDVSCTRSFVVRWGSRTCILFTPSCSAPPVPARRSSCFAAVHLSNPHDAAVPSVLFITP